MNSSIKFSLGKEPFIRKADGKTNTNTIMRDFVIALIPIILYAWVKNGLLPMIDGKTDFGGMIKPLAFILVGGLTTFAVEYLFYWLTSKEKLFTKKTLLDTLLTVKNSFAVIPGLLLAMILPLNTSFWVLIVCCLFATVVGKLLFGGFACNIFNPALVGYLFFSVAYGGLSSYLNPSEVITVVSGATPLANAATMPLHSGSELISSYGSIWNFIIGSIPGSLAETSGLLCLVAFVWLVVRKVINWRIPVFYVGTVFVLTYLVAVFCGRPGDLLYPLFHVFSGGLLFGAVFMATEPVTSPRTPNGKIVYALGLGVLTVMVRFLANAPEGVATSIMAMNIFTVIIDRNCAVVRAQRSVKKTAVTYSVMGLILVALSAYTLSAATSIPDSDFEFVNVTQDLNVISDEKFYAYTIKIDGEEVVVYTDSEKNITSISNDAYTDDYFVSNISEIISAKSLSKYYKAAYKVGEDYVVEVKVKSYGKQSFTVYCTFDSQYTLTSVSYKTVSDGGDYAESYESEANLDSEYGTYNPSFGKPEEILPSQIVANPNDIDSVGVITGATLTSNGFKNAAKQAIEYINKVKNSQVEFKTFGLEE